ncbi:MAG: MarR family transcriptional regulator [Rhodoferax sp.]|uniref:MarR family winged helix-turn-helix transcriptional regulator n=1 Tax=Rhodoferax sp. TaxID=50421 RepID=UPI0027366C6A|nr:MarR family transcriptional regulator [Rhodoferax sp.]MDP2679113.1 MarR family transcriptional regulator [Rhodoferax sp.]
MASRTKSKQPAPRPSGSSIPENDPFAEMDLLKDSLGYAIKCAQVRTYELLFQMLGPNAITPARLSALSIISTRSSINQSELAAELRITRASVVKVIDTLESLGFVQRQSIAGDRRSYALVVTEQGKNELLGMRQRMDAYELAISSQLTTAERVQLMVLLAKVAAA